MTARKKNKQKAQTAIGQTSEKWLKMKNGSMHRVIRSDGKYFYCENTQFRMENPQIAEIMLQEMEQEQKDGEAYG